MFLSLGSIVDSKKLHNVLLISIITTDESPNPSHVMQMSCDHLKHQILPCRRVKLSPPIKRRPSSAQSASGTAEVSGRDASYYRSVSVIVASHQAECVACHVLSCTGGLGHRTSSTGHRDPGSSGPGEESAQFR